MHNAIAGCARDRRGAAEEGSGFGRQVELLAPVQTAEQKLRLARSIAGHRRNEKAFLRRFSNKTKVFAEVVDWHFRTTSA